MSWRDGLAPGLERAADGELLVGGVRAGELCAAYGSPLLVIDLAVLDAAIADYTAACAPFDIEVAYSGKALLCAALAKHFATTPLAIDVCSLGELITAERGGFPAERLRMHGCGKTAEEVRAIVDRRVAETIVDGVEEIARLGAVADPQQPIDVLLRINTGIEAHTHAFVRTSGENSKFGIDGPQVLEALALAARYPGLRVRGLHSHIGSQIFDVDAFGANVDIAIDLYAAAVQAGWKFDALNVGGGFGVEASADQTPPAPIAGFAALLAARSAARAAHHGIAPPRLGIEPGRGLIARAGTTLYRVMAVKQHGAQRFAIIDGGLADNPRPALYGAYHHVVTASRAPAAAMLAYAVCGRSCESDAMGSAALPGDLGAGELVAMCTTGAYTFSMAGNYNRFPKPAVAFVAAGGHRLAVRREPLDHVVAMDVLE